MAVHSLTKTIHFLQCDFCGSVFDSEESARINGCTKGEPPLPSDFHIGDIVITELAVCAGLEQVGYETGECRILHFQKPCPFRVFPWQPSFNYGGLENPPTMRHEWLVVVEPLGKPAMVEETYFKKSEVVRVSALSHKS